MMSSASSSSSASVSSSSSLTGEKEYDGYYVHFDISNVFELDRGIRFWRTMLTCLQRDFPIHCLVEYKTNPRTFGQVRGYQQKDNGEWELRVVWNDKLQFAKRQGLPNSTIEPLIHSSRVLRLVSSPPSSPTRTPNNTPHTGSNGVIPSPIWTLSDEQKTRLVELRSSSSSSSSSSKLPSSTTERTTTKSETKTACSEKKVGSWSSKRKTFQLSDFIPIQSMPTIRKDAESVTTFLHKQSQKSPIVAMEPTMKTKTRRSRRGGRTSKSKPEKKSEPLNSARLEESSSTPSSTFVQSTGVVVPIRCEPECEPEPNCETKRLKQQVEKDDAIAFNEEKNQKLLLRTPIAVNQSRIKTVKTVTFAPETSSSSSSTKVAAAVHQLGGSVVKDQESSSTSHRSLSEPISLSCSAGIGLAKANSTLGDGAKTICQGHNTDTVSSIPLSSSSVPSLSSSPILSLIPPPVSCATLPTTSTQYSRGIPLEFSPGSMLLEPWMSLPQPSFLPQYSNAFNRRFHPDNLNHVPIPPLHQEVVDLLRRCGCEDSISHFVKEGFDSLESIQCFRSDAYTDDLKTLIPKMAPRIRFKSELCRFFSENKDRTNTSPL